MTAVMAWPDSLSLLPVSEFWFAMNSGALPERLTTDAVIHLMRAQDDSLRLGAAVCIACTLRAAGAQPT